MCGHPHGTCTHDAEQHAHKKLGKPFVAELRADAIKTVGAWARLCYSVAGRERWVSRLRTHMKSHQLAFFAAASA